MRGLACLVAGLWLAAPVSAPAEPLSQEAAAILAAEREGRLGTVSGRVYGEARRTGQAEQPLTGARVTLVPGSARLLTSLDRARERARTDPRAQTGSSAEVRDLLDGYVRFLAGAGAGHLAQVATVDDEGAFHFEQVPAGAWLVLASRMVQVDRSGAAARKKERESFLVRPALVGYDAVSLWLRRVTVSAGETAVLELSDRGVWMTGIEERRGKGAGP